MLVEALRCDAGRAGEEMLSLSEACAEREDEENREEMRFFDFLVRGKP